MKKLLITTVILLSVVSIRAQETMVHIDEEGKLDFIDAKLEKKLGLFSEYKGLKEVRLYQISDSGFVLEILYQPESKLLKVRKPLTREQVQELRKKVSERISLLAPETVINQDGRTKLLVSTSLVSLGYYGWTIPTIMRIDDSRAFVGLYMLGSGAGFFVPFMATRKSRVTDADATLSVYGQTRGILHGICLSHIIHKYPDDELLHGMGILFSIAEGLGGYYWADRTRMSAGRASAIGALGDFGIAVGMGTAHFTGWLEDDRTDQRLPASLFLGSVAGIASGAMVSRNNDYSRGDAIMLRGAGVLGAAIPAAVAYMTEPDNKKVYTAVSTIGLMGGIYVGHILAKKNEFTTSQGVMIGLSEAAGSLIGLGTGYLFSSDSDNEDKVIIGSSAFGALAGFAIMTANYARKGRITEKNHAFNLDINPNGLLGLVRANKQSPVRGSVSLFNASLRF